MKQPTFRSNWLCALFLLAMVPGATADDLAKVGALDGGIKTMLLGKGKNELLRDYPSQATLIEIPTEGESISAIKFALYGSTLKLYLKDSVVTNIEARDKVFRTSSGLRVGDSLKTVRAKHKEGKFFSGFEEGGYISYQIKEGKVVFVFDHGSIPYSRFLDSSVNLEDPDVLDCEVESILVKQ